MTTGYYGYPVPPGAPGAGTPPGIGDRPILGPFYQGEPETTEQEEAQDRIRWSEAAALADQHRSDADLRRDAEQTRERIGAEVAELRHRFGLDEEAKLRRAEAHGPLAPARRHPFTAAAAAVGVTVTALMAWRIGHRHNGENGNVIRKGAKGAKGHLTAAGHELKAAVSEARPHRRTGLARLTHR